MGTERRNPGGPGEDEAARFLKKNGYLVLERNYATALGEIDIIAKKNGVIIFIEVKSRTSPLFGPPQHKITKKKRLSVLRAALIYLKANGLLDKDARIDVIAVNFDKKGPERIELIENAFGIEERW